MKTELVGTGNVRLFIGKYFSITVDKVICVHIDKS